MVGSKSTQKKLTDFPQHCIALGLLLGIPFYLAEHLKQHTLYGNTALQAPFPFDDLRHTTGSWLAMSGKEIYTIAKVLGHKDLRMSARYSHLSAQYLSDAVRDLDKVFEEKREVAGSISLHRVLAPMALLDEEIVNAL